MRCPLRDMEEEDIGAYFDAARGFIDAAAAAGGAVLVHCHEGKSRSVTLVLAYFMQTQVWGTEWDFQYDCLASTTDFAEWAQSR